MDPYRFSIYLTKKFGNSPHILKKIYALNNFNSMKRKQFKNTLDNLYYLTTRLNKYYRHFTLNPYRASDKDKENIAEYTILIRMLRQKTRQFTGISFDDLYGMIQNRTTNSIQPSKFLLYALKDTEIKKMIKYVMNETQYLFMGPDIYMGYDFDDGVYENGYKKGDTKNPPFFNLKETKRITDIYRRARKQLIDSGLITARDKFKIQISNA